MYRTLLVTCAWYLGTTADVLILVIILRRCLLPRWPSLFSYAALSLMVDGILYLLNPHKVSYFNIYWGWISCSALLRLWVMADILRSFPGGSIVGRKAVLAVLGIALMIAAGAWKLASSDITAHRSPVAGTALLVDAAVSYSWGVFLLTLFAAIWLSRLGWARQGSVVAIGTTIKVIVSIWSSYLLATGNRDGRHLAVTMSAVASCVALIAWVTALCLDEFSYAEWTSAQVLSSKRTTRKGGSPCF